MSSEFRDDNMKHCMSFLPQHLGIVKKGDMMNNDRKYISKMCFSKETNKQQLNISQQSIIVIWYRLAFGGRGGNGHDGCMERLILTLSAGVPDNADHLVSRGRKDMTIFSPIQPVIYKI